MKFFKKKKSDKNLSTANQDQRSSTIFDSPMSSSIAKKPLPNDSALLQNSNSQMKLDDKRASPVLVMPKPRRLLTPTRNILGRFDHDKTQVEDNHQHSYHQEISPILLPTPREDLSLMKTTSRVPQIPTVSSLSTILSDDSSSRVYMSACESVTNSADDNQSVNLPDMLLPQNQPKQNVTELKRPIPIVSTTSSATVTPRLHHPKPIKQIIEQSPIVNPPEVQSHIQIEEDPDLHREKQTQIVDLVKPEPTAMRAQSNPIYPSAQDQVQFEEHLQRQRQERQHRLQKQPFEPPKPIPKKAPHPSELQSQAQFEEQLERQRQKQRQIEKEQEQLEKQRIHQEQEQILKELKNQIEFMEQQRIKDREEWNRKEQELLSHRHKMMETLMETKDQINTVLKSREENSKIAYDKQLRQQQLNQLHQKVSEMAIHAHQIVDHQQMEQEDVPESYNPPQNGHYEHVYEEEFPPEDSPSRRRMNRSRSEEYLRYNTRSSSRSSHHYPEAPPYYNDEQYVRQSNSRNTSAEESWKSSVSRKSSNASNKSRSVAPPPPRYQRRPRARSIEETRWYQEQQQWMEYMNDYQRSQSKPRRSRSVGRDSQRRYSGYMEDDDDVDYYEEDRPPRYNHYQQQPYVYGPPADYYYRRHPSMVPPQQSYMVYDQPTTRQRYSYN